MREAARAGLEAANRAPWNTHRPECPAAGSPGGLTGDVFATVGGAGNAGVVLAVADGDAALAHSLWGSCAPIDWPRTSRKVAGRCR